MPDAPATPQPLCPSCEFNVDEQYFLAGRFTTGARCRKSVVTFPHATHCPYYERTPGAD